MVSAIILLFLTFCNQKVSITTGYLNDNPDLADDLGLEGMITPEGDQGAAAIDDYLKESDVAYLGPLRVELSLNPSDPKKTEPTNFMNSTNASIYQQAMALDVKAAEQGTTSPGAFDFLGCGAGGYHLGFTDINVQGSIPRGPDAAKQCGYLVSNPPKGTVVDFNFSITEFGPNDRRQCISVRLKGYADSQRTAEFCAKIPLKKHLTLAVNAEFTIGDKLIEDRVSNISIPTYGAFTQPDAVKALASIRQPDQTNNRPKDLMGFISSFKDALNGAIKFDVGMRAVNVFFLGLNLKGLKENYHDAWLAMKSEVKSGIPKAELNKIIKDSKLNVAPPNKVWELFKAVCNANNDLYFLLSALDINRMLDSMPSSHMKDQMAVAWKTYDNFANSPLLWAGDIAYILNGSKNFILEKTMKSKWSKNGLFRKGGALASKAAQKKFYSWLSEDGVAFMNAARDDAWNIVKKDSSLLKSADVSANTFQRIEKKIQNSADELFKSYQQAQALSIKKPSAVGATAR